MALDMASPFVWGSGGRRLTPEEILAERKAAMMLGQEAMSTAPVGHWSAGLNRVAQGLMSGYDSYTADQASKQNGTESAAIIQAMLGGAGGTTPVVAPVAAPMGNTSIPVAAAGTVPNDANAVPGTVGMNQRLADLSYDFIDDNPGTSLSSGVRSTADQARLYADRGNNPNPVALPGTSKHERGQAIDIGGMSPVARALLPQYGLAQPVPNDPPHVELAAPTQMASADPAVLPVNAAEAQGYVVPGQTAAPVAARSAINPVIAQAMTSPYASDAAKKIGTMLFQNDLEARQKANDPLRQGQLQKLQQELTPLAAPYKDADGNLVQRDALGKINVLRPSESRPTSVSEYEYYKSNLPEGQNPMPYDTWATAKARAGAMNVSNNVSTGTIPQGYEQFTDPETKAIRMRPIPGGPKDPTKSDTAKADSRSISTDVVTNAASLARAAMDTATLPTTGTAGKMLSGLGETGAAELNRQVNVLTANAKVENLNAMRAASPTGGALGAVSDSENAMMAAKSGALDPGAPKVQFQRALEDYERTLLRVVHGKKEGDAIFDQTRKQAGQPPAAMQNGATATNPQTGQKIILQNGKWVPFS